jgi:hypothetical protein
MNALSKSQSDDQRACDKVKKIEQLMKVCSSQVHANSSLSEAVRACSLVIERGSAPTAYA